MLSRDYLFKAVSIILIAIISIGPILNTSVIAKASTDDAIFYDTEADIIAHKFATPTGGTDESFTLNNLVPYFSIGGSFDTPFTCNVKWDGNAVAAVFTPAILEDYKYQNQNYQGQIIAKRITIVGLIAVFRGSHHEGTIPNGYYTEDYMIKNGTIYLHAGVQQLEYQYTIHVETETTDTWEIATEAWAKVSVGLSAKFKLFNFTEAGLDLASAEAGVKFSVKYDHKESTKYVYTVTFSIPTYKIRVNYQAKANVTDVLIVSHHGSRSLSIPLNTVAPTGSYTETTLYKLNAVGSYIAYSDYMDIAPLTRSHYFKGNYTTGTIIFG